MRNTGYLDTTSKKELFNNVPKHGKAFGVAVTQFKRDRHGLIDRRRPFVYGVMAHATYGYIAPGSTEFVPVFTRRSDKQPFTRSAQEAS